MLITFVSDGDPSQYRSFLLWPWHCQSTPLWTVGFQRSVSLLSIFFNLAFRRVMWIFIRRSLRNSALGFTPEIYSTGVIDFGLWSFEGPNGSCLSHREAYQDFSWAVSVQTSMAWSWFINSDISWTASRIFAIASFLFGTFSFVSSTGPDSPVVLLFTSKFLAIYTNNDQDDYAKKYMPQRTLARWCTDIHFNSRNVVWR